MTLAGADILELRLDELLRFEHNHSPYVAQGEWWRLLSCAFLHVGAVHLAFNMFALSSLRIVEGLFGAGRFLVIYFLSALAASIASALWNPDGISAGA